MAKKIGRDAGSGQFIPVKEAEKHPKTNRGRDNQAEQEEVAVAQAGCGSKYGPHFKMRVQCPMIRMLYRNLRCSSPSRRKQTGSMALL